MSLPHSFAITLSVGQIASGGGGGDVDMTINVTQGGGATSSTGSLSTMYSSMAFDQHGVTSSILNTQAEFTRLGSGIVEFLLPAGDYNWKARGAAGSGQQHYTNIEYQGSFTLATDSYVGAAVGNNGLGSYSGGGATALVKHPGQGQYTSSSVEPIFVIGGAGGGYSELNPSGMAADITNNLSTAQTQRNFPGDVNYDEGAGIFNNYTPRKTQGNGSAPGHYVTGFNGGSDSGCGGGDHGGFGGGAGSCPGAGGGYVGGKAGNNSPHYGGGGGQSYYDSSYVNGTPTKNKSASATNSQFNAFTTNSDFSGKLEIWTA